MDDERWLNSGFSGDEMYTERLHESASVGLLGIDVSRTQRYWCWTGDSRVELTFNDRSPFWVTLHMVLLNALSLQLLFDWGVASRVIGSGGGSGGGRARPDYNPTDHWRRCSGYVDG